ncbi:MAG: gamma-glutamyltransferase, partial [Lentisphaerae bacterium]|nr:gamma-glutamyltransferase [Lentisphaerota bacterium]
MKTGSEVVSRKGVVAANPPPAARIGAAVLEAGGNAMDAAVAASMACCMLRPNQTGIGGYVCSAVVLDAKAGKVWCVDANGMAPAAARPDMYRLCSRQGQQDRDGINEWEYACSVAGNDNVFGPLSVATPGMMAGMGFIHERWGRLPWPKIVAPSQALLA